MIILGKDKLDERYNIDDNGVITDLQGNVQKTQNKISTSLKIYQQKKKAQSI